MVKRLLTMQETQVQSLGQEDLLEREMASHSSILAWKIPWTEEPSRLYTPWGRKESDTTKQLHFLFLLLLYFSVFPLIPISKYILPLGHSLQYNLIHVLSVYAS